MAQPRFELFEGLYEPVFDLQQQCNRLVVWIITLLDEHVPQLGTSSIALDSPIGFYLFFAIQLVLLALSWVGVYLIFNLIWPKFRAINPSHKKWYVVANFSKAFFLGLQCFSVSWLYYSINQYKCTPNPILEFLGYPPLGECDFRMHPNQPLIGNWGAATYVMTDVLALVMVPKLPKSTVIHHVATGLFLLSVFHFELDTFQVGRKIFLYGFWSTFSFMVNGFLALRVMYTQSFPLRIYAAISAFIYSTCCFANWILHIVWVADGAINNKWGVDSYLTNGIYLLMVGLLVNDDLVLMKWLFQYASGALKKRVKKDKKGKKDKKKKSQ